MAKEFYVIKIGPLMMKALELQKDNIKEATYEVVDSSNYQAGEILAKKLIEKGLV